MRSLEESNSQRQKVDGGCQGLGGEGIGSCCLLGTEFQFGEMEKVLELDVADGCRTM